VAKAISPNIEQVDSIAQACRRAAELWPERNGLYVELDDVQLTFSELEAQTNRYADALATLGVTPHTHVAIMLPNCSAFPLLWLGLAKLRAVMVPLGVKYGPHDAHHVLADSGATHFITTNAHLERLQVLGFTPPERLNVLTIDAAANDGLAGALHAASDSQRSELPRPEDRINIQYTSGTTGMPKGCVLSHRYWLTIARKNVSHPPLIGNEDTMLTAQAFYYMDPQWNLITSLAAGATLVMLDGFHPSTFWSRVREHCATYLYCLGAMPSLLLNSQPTEKDREHAVRRVYCSAIPRGRHRELEERFGVRWFEAYGMTEAGAISSIHPDEQSALLDSGCVGTAAPFREIRIVDAANQPVERGEVGEIVVRGTGLMDGYHSNDAATAEIFRGGWLHTGDLGTMDEAGRIYFAGRTKDMIRRGGENVAAAEVEQVLQLHPDVSLAACVPVEDELRGEEIKAYVLVSESLEDAEGFITGLAEFCAQRLARFKVPRYWSTVTSLPMTASSRVAKGELLTVSDLRAGSFDLAEKAWH
jgi:crotonobetaine/carnitine-CoA ligase